MTTVIYPAVLKTVDHKYQVWFPDFSNAFCEAETEAAGVEAAIDQLGLKLVDKTDFPTGSSISQVESTLKEPENCKVVLVALRLEQLTRLGNKKRVRTNVTIPQELKEEAKRRGLNISEILTTALTQKMSG